MILVLLLVLMAGPAAAHGTLPGGNGFGAGALHPVVATEHLLALLVAGLALGRGAPVAAGALALLAGVAGGLAVGAGPVPALPLIVATALGTGAMLIAARDGPAGVALILALILVLGWMVAADTDMPPGAGIAARAGVAAGAGLILLNAAALAAWVAPRWPIALRVAGSWGMAIALLLLAFQWGPVT